MMLAAWGALEKIIKRRELGEESQKGRGGGVLKVFGKTAH